jgi:hypothetical protein
MRIILDEYLFRSLFSGVSVVSKDARSARTACGGSIRSTESRPTNQNRDDVSARSQEENFV